jgi:hypothetical protein
MDKDHLYLLEPPVGSKGFYQLHVYTRDHGRKPVEIVLKFEMKGSSSMGSPTQLSEEQFGAPGSVKMLTSDQGLCFVSPYQGVWFLPFKSIEASLKSQPAGDTNSAPPIASQTPKPSPAKADGSQPVGDLLDPGFAPGSFR